jgi:hypothetical protein
MDSNSAHSNSRDFTARRRPRSQSDLSSVVANSFPFGHIGESPLQITQTGKQATDLTVPRILRKTPAWCAFDVVSNPRPRVWLLRISQFGTAPLQISQSRILRLWIGNAARSGLQEWICQKFEKFTWHHKPLILISSLVSENLPEFCGGSGK